MSYDSSAARPRLVVAYRVPLNKRMTGKDDEIVCAPCGQGVGATRAIVWHSESGQHLRHSAVVCRFCGQKIVVKGN
jgi:DNA-directed RNA polymerase subunit RPC12/RpoP